jgi:pimeloyl-ACP methyl ester carboxylesterase
MTNSLPEPTTYLARPEGRIGYDIGGPPSGLLVVLVPGMGDLRSAYRFLAPGLREAGYRVACTDLRGHGDSDATFSSYGDVDTADDSMAAGSAVLVAADRPLLVRGLVLIGPFVRDPKTSAMKRALLRTVMAKPWAAISWKGYLPKLYAGRKPADFDEYRAEVIRSLRKPGHEKAFSLTTRTDHKAAGARLGDVKAPALVVMGEQDPDFPSPKAEAEWIAGVLYAEIIMVPEAGHYPQSQRPDVTTDAVLRFLKRLDS